MVSAQVAVTFSEDDLTKAEVELSYCSSPLTSPICRAFPWNPNDKEGVTIAKNIAVIIVRATPPQDHPFFGLIDGVLKARKHEVYAALLLTEVSMRTALESGPFSDVLLILRDENQVNVAAFQAPRATIISNPFLNEEWKTSMKDKVGWEPPKDFQPFYQFQSF